MTDCIFCKIIKGELPAFKLYEDENIISFLDIFPIHPGHALVVPKKHSQDIFDTDEETMPQMIARPRAQTAMTRITPQPSRQEGVQRSSRGCDHRPPTDRRACSYRAAK